MPYSADDLALAALLRIVPRGYRLVDVSDERFVGVRDKFVRLALRHLGPRPSLVGFTGPGQDPRAAAEAAAAWAAENLRPSAIQRRVNPGVVVVALDPPAGSSAGRVPGLPVHASLWLVSAGRVRASSPPPGAPPARLVKQAVASLERGEPPPSIGTIDVAERALMTGPSVRRGYSIGGGAGLVAVIGIFVLLRFLPSLLFGRGGQPQPQGGTCSAAQGCISLGAGSNGSTQRVSPGNVLLVRLPGLGNGQDGCPQASDPAVLALEQCTTTPGEVLAVFRAQASGHSATLTRPDFRVVIQVS